MNTHRDKYLIFLYLFSAGRTGTIIALNMSLDQLKQNTKLMYQQLLIS